MIQQLQPLDRPITSLKTDEPVVLCAADDNYVQPLAVTLHSAVTSLRLGKHLHVLLMDGGIKEDSWSALKETLVGLPISIHVVRPDRSEVTDLSISHHITHTAYFRLLAARLLPASIDKIIYLDSDVLVRGDLTELWNFDVGNQYCLAAVDIACPYIDARKSDPRFRNSIPYLAELSPVRNWRALGLEGSAHYFNSGVMVINLKRWREERIDEQLLACLRENSRYVWCWDQYALNVVFAGQWGPLPPRWNQGAHIFEYPDASCSPIDRVQFEQMRDDPALIHFTTEFKPWHFQLVHPWRKFWFESLDQTAWTNWRPTKSRFSWKDWWNRQAVYWIRKCTINYRRVSSLIRR